MQVTIGAFLQVMVPVMLILGGVGTVVARLASAEKDIAALLAWKALREKDPERLATLEAHAKLRPPSDGGE